MGRNLAAFFGGLFIAITFFGFAAKSHEHEFNAAVCASPALRTVEARVKAREDGYVINRRYDCVDKASFEQVNAQRSARERVRSASAGSTNAAPLTLAEARRQFATKISVHATVTARLPNPPADLYVRSDYKSATGRILPAYVTADPRDGLKHPAIIWLTGGDTNSLEEFLKAAPSPNQEPAAAFRVAGVVVMLMTLRGSNGDPHGKEYFYGEVDDVLAAADQLAQLSYVSSDHIFLGGRSTGGTLALLAAESSSRFAGVFAFGPAAEVTHYSTAFVPVNFSEYDSRESTLRSPVFWLQDITTPTYVIEGKSVPGGSQEAGELCSRARNPNVHCILAEGADHFSVLANVSTVIAARLAISDSREFAMRSEEFQ